MICQTCHGNGFVRLPSREPVRCPACGGSGETKEKEETINQTTGFDPAVILLASAEEDE